MTHRIVPGGDPRRAAFVAAALVFAWRSPRVAPRTGAAAGSRTVSPREDGAVYCARCHRRRRRAPLPVTHRDSPRALHRRAMTCGARDAVPHTVSMGEERCVLCHGDPALKLGMPASTSPSEIRRCTFCHQQADRREDGAAAATRASRRWRRPPFDAPSRRRLRELSAPATAVGRRALACRPAMARSAGETCRLVCHLRAAGLVRRNCHLTRDRILN